MDGKSDLLLSLFAMMKVIPKGQEATFELEMCS